MNDDTAKKTRIALLSMPVASPEFASLQLALLKPTLERAGFEVEVYSMFLHFGAQVGWRMVRSLGEVLHNMIGEWIWAKTAFGELADDHEDVYFEEHAEATRHFCERAGCELDDLRWLRNQAAPAFIEHCLETIDWSRYQLVGFTVVFQQLLASLGLARRLKEQYPQLPIIMGGAGFESDIADEVMRCCPQVDYLHCGDADESFPELVRRLEQQQSMQGLPGVMWRDGDTVVNNGRAPNYLQMNQTPVPDFDEYFLTRQETGYAEHTGIHRVMLPIEAARGCWWGAKHHCAFCGANAAGLEYRAKDVENVLTMLHALASRYRQFEFDFIDNIVSPNYVEELFPRLYEEGSDYQFHIEVRPSLRRKQLREMRKGGLISVQPGIESFSTHLLTIMRKHITGMRNIELVKWCTYYGINALYFILVRFPGETVEDYETQRAVMQRLHHLQPPTGMSKARADRGSPMFKQPDCFSISNLRPAASTRFIFPEQLFNLHRVSYYYEHDMENTVPEETYLQLYQAFNDWKAAWARSPRPTLSYRGSRHVLVISDTRCEPREFVYRDREAQLYQYCIDAHSKESICKQFGGEASWIDQALDDMVSNDLVLHLDDRYLSLALPNNKLF